MIENVREFAKFGPYPHLPEVALKALRIAFNHWHHRGALIPGDRIRHDTRLGRADLQSLLDRSLLVANGDAYRPKVVGLLYLDEAQRLLSQLDHFIVRAHETYEPDAPPLTRKDFDRIPADFQPALLQALGHDVDFQIEIRDGEFSVPRTENNCRHSSLSDAVVDVYRHLYQVQNDRKARERLLAPGPLNMRLRSMHVRRFRALHQFDLTLGRNGLTVLVGVNGVGKSTVLDAVSFISRCMHSSLEHAVAAEGGLARLRTLGTTEPIDLEVRFNVDLAPSITRTGSYRMRFNEASPKRAPLVVELERLCVAGSDGSDRELVKGERGIVQLVRSKDDKVTERFRGAGELSMAMTDLSGFSLLSDLRQDLGSVLLLDRDPWLVEPDREGEAIPLARKRHAVPLQALLIEIAQFPSRIDDLTAAMRELVPSVVRVHVDPYNQRAPLQIEENGIPGLLQLDEISAGTRQMLLLATLYVSPRPARNVLLEEPDAALHPRALPALRDLCRSIARTSNVIATTHSSSFISLLDADHEVVAMDRDENGVRAVPLAAALEDGAWTRTFGTPAEGWMRKAWEH